jgi:hypothetical protein
MKRVWGIFSFILLGILLCPNFISAETLTSPANVSYDSSIVERFENGSDTILVMVKINDSKIPIESTNEQKEDWRLNKTQEVFGTLSPGEITLRYNIMVGVFEGNITKEGFYKLINNSDVALIYDMTGAYPTTAQNGSEDTNPANVSYDSELIGQFLLSDWVHVTVNVKDFSGITINYENDSVEVQTIKDSQRWDVYRNTSEAILSALSNEEFRLERKSEWGNGFSGNITKKGFDKLLNDTRIRKIYADKKITNASVGTVVKNLAPYLIIIILIGVLTVIFIKIKNKKNL